MTGPENHSERIATLEQGQKSIFLELSDIKRTLETIVQNQASRNMLTAGNLLAGALVLLGCWAAFIHPLESDSIRHEDTAKEMRAAVLLQNEIIKALDNRQVNFDAVQKMNVAAIEDLKEHGSRNLESQLAVLRGNDASAQSQIDGLKEELNDIQEHGSPITDKRLSVVEFRLDHCLDKNHEIK